MNMTQINDFFIDKNRVDGITEEDFLSAELTMVPASPAREIGLDRSLIGAYGRTDNHQQHLHY